MLGLASRRWAVNKLCQTFSIKAFRADNSENIWQIIMILLKENYSGEWHYYFLYANEVNICQPRVLCWYPPAQRLAAWLTAGPELPEWLSQDQRLSHVDIRGQTKDIGCKIQCVDFSLSNLSPRIWKPLLKRHCDAEHESAPNCFSKSWLGSECRV